MTIRDATSADLAAIARIQAAAPEAAHWDPAGYLEHRCRVAVEGPGMVGFLVTRAVTGDALPAEREILNLAVDPPRRREGIARALLEDEFATGPAVWFLEVRESNLAARSLYENLGFRFSGRRPAYYQSPTEAAIVLVRHS